MSKYIRKKYIRCVTYDTDCVIMIVIQDYKLIDRIGKGMYGEVWQGHHILNKRNIAIKVERKSSINSLKREMIILQHLKTLRCIPFVKLFGQTVIYNYIVMEILGGTIESYCSDILPNTERIDEIKWIGLNMLNCLREIHENGIIHRDIKPSNFLLTCDKKNIKLIDFGLARQFKDNQGRHKPPTQHKHLIGTLRYISTHVHEGCEPSRRDDVISMTYILLYLWNKSLPWQSVTDCGKITKTQLVYEFKKILVVDELRIDISSKMDDILEYVYSLAYYDEPDYDYMSFLLNTI